jgi:hypothetical protein
MWTYTYSFLQHIASMDTRPDNVWWDDQKKLLTILELTIPFAYDGTERKLENGV